MKVFTLTAILVIVFLVGQQQANANIFRDLKHDFKHLGHDVKHIADKAVHGVGHEAKKIAHHTEDGLKHAAKDTAKGVETGAKEVGKVAKEGLQYIKLAAELKGCVPLFIYLLEIIPK